MSVEDSRDPGYYQALGRAIKVLRVTRGLERKDLADRAGISYPYLSQIESGAKRASSEVIRAIAEALDVRPHELLESADVMTSQPAAGSASRTRARSVQALERVVADTPAPAAPMMAAMAAPPPPPPPARRAARWFHAEAEPVRSEPPPTDETRRQLLGELVALTETLDESDLERLVDLARRLAHS